MNQKKLFLALGILEILIAVGAVPAGLMFMLAPDGSLMGMNTAALAGSPFSNFFLPGLALFLINGLANIFNAVLCFRKKTVAAWIGLALGIGMLIWIGVQLAIIGFNHFLQPTYLIIGLIEIMLSVLLLRKLNQPDL